MTVNVWIALSDAAKTTIAPLLDDDGYDGPHLTAVRIFRKMVNRGVVSKMFRAGTFGGKTWHLFSVYLPSSGKVKDALDYLEANYSGHVNVVGAWHWDGRQVGTQWELDQDGQRVQENVGTEESPIWRDAVTGTPLYTIPTNALLKIMPTIKQRDENGDLVSETEPTELTDVNILQGQSPRRFS